MVQREEKVGVFLEKQPHAWRRSSVGQPSNIWHILSTLPCLASFNWQVFRAGRANGSRPFTNEDVNAYSNELIGRPHRIK